ncbi:MAG: histidine phosphatase family protein [Rhodospirillaceae bacterium]|nr:histidine phosphatase family protein [Rhodospirillaceae bacterium]
MTPLVMMRHGPTEWAAGKWLQGRADVPLSPSGREVVRRWRLPPVVQGSLWLSSPLGRAVETARLLGHEPRLEPRLIEADWGEWQGHTLTELREAMPKVLQEAEAGGLDFRPPGGESPRDVQARVLSLLAELGAGNRPAVAVCHKGVIRAVYALAVGWDMKDKPPDRLRDDACHRFWLAADGTPSVDRLNLPLVP